MRSLLGGRDLLGCCFDACSLCCCVSTNLFDGSIGYCFGCCDASVQVSLGLRCGDALGFGLHSPVEFDSFLALGAGDAFGCSLRG